MSMRLRRSVGLILLGCVALGGGGTPAQGPGPTEPLPFTPPLYTALGLTGQPLGGSSKFKTGTWSPDPSRDYAIRALPIPQDKHYHLQVIRPAGEMPLPNLHLRLLPRLR
ncbi:hypothetical protein [Calidithermus chliarophilus]|uniref:hypothetical protein n=1 Tax=Calidithermus chliarophilus TaxID=52023 RepID=UPI0012F6C72A|nr:hypothetical protein [Calidithermus chliarophilus]